MNEFYELTRKKLTEKGEVDFKILVIFRTGSTLFLPQEKRKKDIDLVIVCENISVSIEYVTLKQNGIIYDLCFIEKNFYKDLLNYRVDLPKYQYWNLFTFLFETLYRDTDEEFLFDFWKYKEQYSKTVKLYVAKLPGFSKSKVLYIPAIKRLNMLFLYIYFIENNSLKITNKVMQEIKELYTEPQIKHYQKTSDFLGINFDKERAVFKKVIK